MLLPLAAASEYGSCKRPVSVWAGFDQVLLSHISHSSCDPESIAHNSRPSPQGKGISQPHAVTYHDTKVHEVLTPIDPSDALSEALANTPGSMPVGEMATAAIAAVRSATDKNQGVELAWYWYFGNCDTKAANTTPGRTARRRKSGSFH